MTKTAQKRLVRDVARVLVDQVSTAIDAGNVPSDWDGHELRPLMADLAVADAAVSDIRKNPRSRRARAYRNTRLISCL